MGCVRTGFVLATAFMLWAGGVCLRAATPIPDADCLECHADRDLTKTNAVGRAISLFVDEARLRASRHGTNTCASCHPDLTRDHPDDEIAARPVDCARCHERHSASYGASVHGRALRQGQEGAATCADCHGGHEVIPASSPASPLHRNNLATTCGGCHEQAAVDLASSVHGRGLAQGEREVPTCTDCHSEHDIQPLKATSPLMVAGEVCSRCHASERINTKFRLPRNRVKTFFESYHGLAARFGSARAANCGSCHGHHLILPSRDPRSTIHASNLMETCGQCHPGATEKFAQGRIHVDDDGGDLGSLINRWVRRFYLALIFGTIGFMLFHNGLAWLRHALAAYRQADRTVVRMDRAQRLQHLTLLVSFILLAWTGFALKYPDSWVAWSLGADETLRRWAHRIAGVVLLGVGVWHLVYLAVRREGRELVRDLWPRWQDARDLGTNLRYLLGRAPAKARCGRFGYAEKLEYWAVVWGTLIMGVTGLMIWLKVDVTRWLPRWTIDVATTVHYYEAILACLAIVVWHFYHVFFDPKVYPINWAFWDGRVTRAWQEEEHPLAEQGLPHGVAKDGEIK